MNANFKPQTSNIEPSSFMRWLLFLSRVAFFCNIFFLLSFVLKLTNWIRDPDLVSTILILGHVLAIIFNLIVNLSYLVLFLVRRRLLQNIPAWLITANILFLIMQLFFILYLNDKQHS
jgi:hypothetical protein